MAKKNEKYHDIDLSNFVEHFGFSKTTQWAKGKSSVNYLAYENEIFNDKIIIKRSINKYCNAINGSSYNDIFSFIQNRLDSVFKSKNTESTSFISALKILDNYLNIPSEKIFFKPKTSANLFNFQHYKVEELPKFSYLSKLGFANEILNSKYFTGKIFNVYNPEYSKDNNDFLGNKIYGNISFPYIKDPIKMDIIGFEQRNLNFKGHSIYSDKKNGVWISNILPESKYLFIVEGAKDAIAHFAIYLPTNIVYCSIGGSLTKEQQITINAIADHYNLKKVIGFDNDIAGSIFTLQFILSELSDFNSVIYDKNSKLIHFNLINKNGLYDFLNQSKYLNSIENQLFDAIILQNDIISFKLKVDLNALQNLSYTFLNSSKSVFKGHLFIQKPVDKDFYESFNRTVIQKKRIKL